MKLKGFSIIEFMISISLGAMLVSGVIGVYLSNKTTFNIQQGLARIQENGRYINYILSNSLRMAGFQGCTNQKYTTLPNRVTTQPHQLNFDFPIYGYSGSDKTWSPNLPELLANKVKPNTDVIEVRMASPSNAQLTTDMTNTTDTITLTNNNLNFAINDIAIISDCASGDIFKITSMSGNTLTHTTSGNSSAAFSKAYQTDAQLMKFEYYAFYIKDTGRVNNRNETIYGLYRMDYSGNEVEIADGVEDLKITYGIDTDNDNNADSYLEASAISTANWSNIVSINASFLLNSIDDLSSSGQQYTYQGEKLESDDYQLRREWTSFVSFRNRGL